MRRVLKYMLIATAALVGLAFALFMFSYLADQQRFREAKNACERGCVQDSGGFPHCRDYCASHPDHYP